MNKTEQSLAHAQQQCLDHGVRLTVKRKQVLAGLLQAERALSAYEIVDYYQVKFGESLSPMSVYRILYFLETEHLVHKLNLVNKYVACAHITCCHEHQIPQFLICQQCQRVEELNISSATVAQLQQHSAQAGFHLLSPQLEINGVCTGCMQQA